MSIRGNDKSYFIDTKRNSLAINLEFAFEDTWDDDAIRTVARLFANQTYYQEFYTTSNTSRRWRCLYVGSPTLLHNGLSQGYVKMQLKCDSAYSYSPQYLSDVIKTSTQDICATGSTDTNITATGHLISTGQYIVNVTRNDAIREVLTVPDANNFTVDIVTGMTVNDIFDKYTNDTISTTFTNSGDKSLKCEYEFHKIGAGDISVVNTTNGNQEMVFESLANGEYLYVDCANEIVLTDVTGTYRYSNMTATSEFLELLYGSNILSLQGDFTMQIRYYYELLQG